MNQLTAPCTSPLSLHAAPSRPAPALPAAVTAHVALDVREGPALPTRPLTGITLGSRCARLAKAITLGAASVGLEALGYSLFAGSPTVDQFDSGKNVGLGSLAILVGGMVGVCAYASWPRLAADGGGAEAAEVDGRGDEAPPGEPAVATGVEGAPLSPHDFASAQS